MRINFFEEFPTPENMAKLDLVDWPCIVLVAAPSLQEFENIKEINAGQYPHITFGWWPILPGSYWVSGLANPADLDRLFTEIISKKQEQELPVLIDLELPIKKYLYIKNLKNNALLHIQSVLDLDWVLSLLVFREMNPSYPPLLLPMI